MYEPWESEGPAQQETYEIPDKEPQDTYEVPDSQEQETYEVPDQGQPEQETYEVPDQEPGKHTGLLRCVVVCKGIAAWAQAQWCAHCTFDGWPEEQWVGVILALSCYNSRTGSVTHTFLSWNCYRLVQKQVFAKCKVRGSEPPLRTLNIEVTPFSSCE